VATSAFSSRCASAPRLPRVPRRKFAAQARAPVATGAAAVAKDVAGKLAAASVAAALAVGAPAMPAQASELDILAQQPGATRFIFDDAKILSRATIAELQKKLGDLQSNTGYHVDIVTLRKLVFVQDPFEFADKVIEKWYPTVEEGDKHGVLLLVQTEKEGAVVGGPSFMKTLSDPVIDGIISENIPVFGNEEKYNEAVSSSVKRIEAALKGEADIPGPQFNSKKRERTYKTKAEASEKKDLSTIVVSLLLFISFVVPMVQFFAYTSK